MSQCIVPIETVIAVKAKALLCKELIAVLQKGRGFKERAARWIMRCAHETLSRTAGSVSPSACTLEAGTASVVCAAFHAL